MVYRYDEASACGIRHLNCLLGGAVGLYPRIVSADRHDRHIDRAVSPSLCESFRHCGVTSENYPASALFDQVSIVAAVRVALRARAPVLHQERSNFGLARSSAKPFALPPIELAHVENRVPCNKSLVARAVITLVDSSKQRSVCRSR